MDTLKPLDSGAVSTMGLGPAKLPETQDPVKAAEQFEALLTHEMLKSMWNTVPKGELISGSSEEQTYKDMLNEALANSIAEGRGIGIKEVILKDINRLAKGT
jgi:Rod binding domain-containing protein